MEKRCSLLVGGVFFFLSLSSYWLLTFLFHYGSFPLLYSEPWKYRRPRYKYENIFTSLNLPPHPHPASTPLPRKKKSHNYLVSSTLRSQPACLSNVPLKITQLISRQSLSTMNGSGRDGREWVSLQVAYLRSCLLSPYCLYRVNIACLVIMEYFYPSPLLVSASKTGGRQRLCGVGDFAVEVLDVFIYYVFKFTYT